MLEPMHEATRRGLHILKSKSNGFSWHQWLSLIIGFICLGLVFFFTFIQQTSTHYDRAYDSELARYIYISPEARALPKKGQLFCWAMTAKVYHETRAPAVNETWLPRCDHGQFFTNELFQPELKIAHSTVFAGIPDSYSNLFFKSRYAFHYIYTKISPDFEWYLKADDDTYVIVENLRAYLSKLNPDLPYYIGYRLRPYLEHGYNAGGAGYVLSRAAMRVFAERLYPNETLCPDDLYEDVGIGRCLASQGIYPLDTRNIKGQQSGALLADAVIGNVQEKNMKKYGASSNEMVFYSYSIGSIYIFVYTILSGEFFMAFSFFLKHPYETYGYGIIFGLLGYLGVNVVLTLVKVSGALVAVTVTTFRKALTIMLSFFLFSKPFTIDYLWAGMIILLAIYLNLYSKNRTSWDGAFKRLLRQYLPIKSKHHEVDMV